MHCCTSLHLPPIPSSLTPPPPSSLTPHSSPQHNLVCSRGYLLDWYRVSFTVGCVVGSPLGGIVSDRCVRQPLILYPLWSVITGALTVQVNESMHHLFWTGVINTYKEYLFRVTRDIHSDTEHYSNSEQRLRHSPAMIC